MSDMHTVSKISFINAKLYVISNNKEYCLDTVNKSKLMMQYNKGHMGSNTNYYFSLNIGNLTQLYKNYNERDSFRIVGAGIKTEHYKQYSIGRFTIDNIKANVFAENLDDSPLGYSVYNLRLYILCHDDGTMFKVSQYMPIYNDTPEVQYDFSYKDH